MRIVIPRWSTDMQASMTTERTTQQFEKQFGCAAQVVADAPGRVNIIGEHVDYVGGSVLPFAIDQRIVCAAAADAAGTIRAYSEPLDNLATFEVSVGGPAASGAWENYVRGMVAGLRAVGVDIKGASLWIGGDLAPGSGMSSSAALCISTGMALAKLAGVDVPRDRMAKIAQSAEHKFAGTPCGLMDQFASSFGRENHALLLNCTSLEHEDIPCKPAGVSFLVIPSGVKHALADGAYEKRVASCQKAFDILSPADPSIVSLSDASIGLLESQRDKFDDETFRRARHVVTEVARLNHAVDALRNDDWPEIGELLYGTQDSLRDDYEVSCKEIDELITMLRAQAGVLGARMVGGGFGGIVLAVVQEAHLEAIIGATTRDYYQAQGLRERAFTVRPSAGASVCEV